MFNFRARDTWDIPIIAQFCQPSHQTAHENSGQSSDLYGWWWDKFKVQRHNWDPPVLRIRCIPRQSSIYSSTWLHAMDFPSVVEFIEIRKTASKNRRIVIRNPLISDLPIAVITCSINIHDYISYILIL